MQTELDTFEVECLAREQIDEIRSKIWKLEIEIYNIHAELGEKIYGLFSEEFKENNDGYFFRDIHSVEKNSVRTPIDIRGHHSNMLFCFLRELQVKLSKSSSNLLERLSDFQIETRDCLNSIKRLEVQNIDNKEEKGA